MAAKLHHLVFVLLIFYCQTVEAIEDDFREQNDQFKANSPTFTYEISNYLIYAISKKRDSTGCGTSALSEVVSRILTDSGVEGVLINNRILNVFGKTISVLKSKAKAAARKGGFSLRRLEKKWRGTTHKFTVYYSEIDKCALEQQNSNLRGQKRALEDTVVEEVSKRLKVEEKLQAALEKSESSCNFYKKRFKNLVKKVIKNQEKATPNKRGSSKKKSFHEFTKRHQYRVKGQMKEQCNATLSFLGHHDFIATKVEIFNNATQEYETLQLVDKDQLPLKENNPVTLTDEEITDLNFWLYIKDKFNISNEAWHELALKSTEMPNMYRLNKRISDLNAKWRLTDTPGEAEGVQISFKESLIEQTKRLKNKGMLKNENTIKVKLSGDGTSIGKRLKIVNFTYTILNEKDIAMSDKGNYLLAVMKTTETYDNLAESLSHLKTEMENFDEIDVEGQKFKIEYFLGGDWKFLACVCGLGPANQDYACIYCKCPRESRCDITKTWSLTDKKFGARTHDEITEHSRSKRFNCKSKPLFNFIPLDHVIIDTLHLFLRISDNLIELLIRELRRKDAIENVKTFPNGFKREKYKHMAGYEAFLKNIGITFEWKVEPNTKKLDYRDLTGPEKLTVFQHIDFNTLLPTYEYTDNLKKLWGDFLDIIGDLKLDYDNEESTVKLKDKIKSWFQQFLNLYQGKDITPYMHTLYCHVPELLKLYKNIAHFNQQGMEKYNDTASKNYFRSSNHRGVSALRQLFWKKQRVQHLEAEGYQREKNSLTCSNCLEQGHNIKTCTKKCKRCAFEVCCGHLDKVNNKWVPSCTL